MRGELPERIRERVQIEEWTEAALAKATAPLDAGEPEPESESATRAFVRRLAEQAEAEARHEALVKPGHA